MSKKLLFQLCLLLPLFLSIHLSVSATMDDDYMNEQHRNQFHFSPEANWMNDPNGMVYYDGEYHLFYQYYPYGTQWGPMHWGHAVSTDLVHWDNLPVALAPDEIGDIFSGSAVIDWNNTAGFGHEAMVAIFTHNDNGNQVQSLAYSNDKGRTWTKYSGNPVMPDPPVADWRDPKVFWHEDTNKWIMILAAHDKAMMYTSSNLKEWTHTSDFERPSNSPQGVWECPELFELSVDGDPNNTRWVMQVSIQSQSIAGGSGMIYFIGDFDGTSFTNHYPNETLWTDYGADFYAAVTWSDVPTNSDHRLWLGWMSNWDYANVTPTSNWRSSMTIPRKMTLTDIPGEGVRVKQGPVSELEVLRDNKQSHSNEIISGESSLLQNINGDALEFIIEINVNNTSANEVGLKVRKGTNQETLIGYDISKNQLFVDRSMSGNASFKGDFAKRHSAPMQPKDGKVKLHIVLDRSSVEVFGNDGLQIITDQIFPDPSSLGVQMYSIGGDVTINSLDVYDLNSIWGTNPFSTNVTGWDKVSGHWVDTTEGKQGRSQGNSFAISSDYAGDFTYESDIKILDDGAGALVFRANRDASDAYVANVDTLNDVVKLFKIENGEHTLIAEHPTLLNNHTVYNLKIEASGDSIKVYLNGNLVIDEMDSTFESGLLGLNVWNATVKFQDVNISNLSGFVSNLQQWHPLNGEWTNTLEGKQGSGSADVFLMTAEVGFDLSYEANIKVTDTESDGAGALVFRANEDATNAYVANVDVRNDVVKLFKFVNGQATVLSEFPTTLNTHTNYHLKVEAVGDSIKVYLNNTLVINTNDSTFKGGYFGLNVWDSAAVFQNVMQNPLNTNLQNHDFEAGDLTGWIIDSGDAFSNLDVTSDTHWWNGTFNHQGTYHLFSFRDGGDALTGKLKSEKFVLSGNGKIDFLISGGNDLNNLSVSLVRVLDGMELFKATGNDSEVYSKINWNASQYIGEEFYLQVVDTSTGDWGHINIDDVNVPVKIP
ncbi:GH32 C-terminal domain-containing protein [Bacillus solitudinis]|uniref:GH32 C-terminal domain-containing protein n=1 Tax=Bacillus solitudinis TaxID=2014074 RepID=UPI000C244ABF|nr:glycoside hydrolase family 32 protein [Bacillus solitudinis]